MAMTRNQKLVIGGLAVGGVVLAIFLATRKAKASDKTPTPEDADQDIYIPPETEGYRMPALQEAPDLTPTNEIPSSDKFLSSQETGPQDPLKSSGWHWGYLGGSDPDTSYAIGTQVGIANLPFSATAVKNITPLSEISLAFYVGPGEYLVQGYYLLGPLKAGYGFEAGDWGIVEVWNPDWHGY
jgi:hypothetical protein